MPSVECLGCCPACSPRWKRLVDSVYPANSQDGLVKNNMNKLTFFAVSNPQKLDRIGEYLSRRLGRDLSHNKIMFVTIAMETMDHLLVACHSQSLNLFVESFLKMVQKLLESSDPDMQCLATTSFVKFSNIEEDTPSYHRRYDFFVSKFSAMCHSNHVSAKLRIRVAGIQGIQGVIRKTVSDELQPDIWEQCHMDKIVPSLLYNMHSATDEPAMDPHEGETAQHAAEQVFRDLICRAAYSNLKSVLRPVLSHLDSHNLWVKNGFPSKCFKIIMFSVQAQYGHVVVQMLMSHLDFHSKSPAELKAKITDILSEAVIIAAGGSIGPSVLDVFNSLLRHLRVSVEYNSPSEAEKISNIRFQESIINTIGEFANHLPDFQKIEILMFVVGKMPASQPDCKHVDINTLLQSILLKTILKVATTYRTVLMANAFPASLKNPLLQISLVDTPSTRIMVQEIFHTLLDRHNNSSKFNTVWLPEDLAELDISLEKPSRQDVYFMKHGGVHILWHLQENFLLLNNTRENFEKLYKTMALMLMEMITDETLVDFAAVILQLQERINSATVLKPSLRSMANATVIAFANLFCEVTALTLIQTHVNQVIEIRKKLAPYLLPNNIFCDTPMESPVGNPPESCLLDLTVFSQAFSGMGMDAALLSKPFYHPGSRKNKAFNLYSSSSSIDLPEQSTGKESDVGSVTNLDLESTSSSPVLKRMSIISATDEITVDKLRTVLDCEEDAALAETRRKQLLDEFQNAPLQKIMEKSNSRNDLNDRLLEILGSVDENEASSSTTVTIDNIKYPAMFVY